MFEKLILYMRHTAIHTVSEASREDLIKYGAKKTIFVIPPAIELTECQKITPKNSQFVYVGRLVFYKNLETIIRAISIIRKSDTEIVLKIIGGGPHKENLEKITRELGLEKNIEFCGYVSEDEKYRIISSSISMVFPSLCEGFGLVILESFLCSRPIIVSNIRPMSDIINDKKEGLVVDATDEEKWAEAMKHIISDTNNALEMGAEGKRKLEEKYRLDSMISKIEEMYYKVVH